MSGLPHSPHALVTGGGRGIGRAIAASLVGAGATVTVLGRNAAVLDEAVGAGAAHFAAIADVSDEAALKAAIAEAHARKPIDILIANAGSAESAPFSKSDSALFARMMDVNFMGVVHAVRAVLPGMKIAPMAASSRSRRRPGSRAMPMSAHMSLPSTPWLASCARSPSRWPAAT